MFYEDHSTTYQLSVNRFPLPPFGSVRIGPDSVFDASDHVLGFRGDGPPEAGSQPVIVPGEVTQSGKR